MDIHDSLLSFIFKVDWLIDCCLLNAEWQIFHASSWRDNNNENYNRYVCNEEVNRDEGRDILTYT